MAAGNIGPAKLIDMLDKGDAFFFEGDLRDFERCTLCKGLVKSHPKSFLKCNVGDMVQRAALADKLIQSGQLTTAKTMIAEGSLKFVSVASREALCCVMQPNALFWDNFAVCQAAKVNAIDIETFLAGL